jgi:CO/xanthine dehydrogenase FAD-binding subunit
MKPAPFDYHAPKQLAEAADLLATLPNAKILAGGQSLVPMMNFATSWSIIWSISAASKICAALRWSKARCASAP